jgi:predicted porin
MARLKVRTRRLLLGLVWLGSVTHVHAEDDKELRFYASLRTQAESVRAGQSQYMDDYAALRDAYSRVGIEAEHALASGTELFARVEAPFDTANLEFRDPYDQGGSGRAHGASLRLALVGIKGVAGQVVAGQQWLPYYNAIAAPVDMFSSYYSGFATYTLTRAADTLAYYSPTFGCFSFSASYSGAGGNRRSTSRIDDRRIQLTGSYALGEARLSVGVDDRGDAGYGRNRLYGAAISRTLGPFQLAAKYEYFDSGDKAPGHFASNGNRAVNLFGSYTAGRNTFKLMLADVETYGGKVLHLGVDHQYTAALKLFAEFYREEKTASVTIKRGGLSDFDARIEGGQAFLLGARYDF